MDGAGKGVFVYHRRYESIETNLTFSNEQRLDDTIVRLVHMSGKHVSTAFRSCDATLPGGHRLAATFRREVSPQGSTLDYQKIQKGSDHDHRPDQFRRTRLHDSRVRVATDREQIHRSRSWGNGLRKDHLPQCAALHDESKLQDT